jgi:hypothetical protein
MEHLPEHFRILLFDEHTKGQAGHSHQRVYFFQKSIVIFNDVVDVGIFGEKIFPVFPAAIANQEVPVIE